MSVNLTRVDITQLPTCSARGTLKLLPFGGHKRQKIVVGTDQMSVVCLSMKHFECKTVFETSLAQEDNIVTPISSVYIQADTQKIYASAGTSVSGINKKGKIYYNLKSNMAESIQNIQVQGKIIVASGEYVLVSLDETGKELHYYMSPDRINDLYKMGDIAVLGCQDSTLRIVQGDTLTFEVALSGAVRSLTELSKTPVRARTNQEEEPDRKKKTGFLGRLRKGGKSSKDTGGGGGKEDTEGKSNEHGGTEGKSNGDSASKTEARQSEGSTSSLDASFAYGTMTGGVGAIHVEDGVARKTWFIPPPRSGEASAANCIRVDDVTGDGVNDMIVARDNGAVQIFSLGEGNDGSGRHNENGTTFSAQGQQWSPTLRVEHEVGESVRSLDVGVVRTPGYDELVVCTYSGRVMSLTTESLSDRATEDKYGRSKAIVGKEAQVKAFRSELKDLHKQVQRESEKLDKLRPPQKKKDKGGSSGFIPMENQFSVNHSFQLMEHDATYQLVMEIPIPISEVILQTTVPVDLLRQDDESAVIMCKTQKVILPNVEHNENGGSNSGNNGNNGNNGNDGSSSKDNDVPQVLATYRPTEKNTRRMKLGLRSIEGQHGELHVYVVSGLEPKMARVLRFAIKPLSMHSRINGLKEKETQLPWNVLSFTGNFTIAQAHSWLSFCLPDIPPHYSATSDNGAMGGGRGAQAMLHFRNAFVGSHLTCTYKDGECCFRSDSVTTITILKQVITQHATNLNQNVQVSTDINVQSIPHFLKLLHPKLQAQFHLSRQMQLVQSMAELTDSNDAIPAYLDAELKYVITHAEEIKMKFDDSKRILRIFYGMVADMYIDVKQQTSGQHSSAQIPLLMKLLDNYDLEKLIEFFER